MSFSLNLKSLLINHGITQKDLSEATGIPRAVLSEYLSEKNGPSAKNVQRIAVYFKVSIDWLMGGGGEAGKMIVAEPGASYGKGGLIEQISRLNKKNRELVAALVETLLKRQEEK